MFAKLVFAVLLTAFAAIGIARAENEGTTSFVARPKIGAAHLTLPSQLTWQSASDDKGGHLVTLSLIVDVNSVLRDIRSLSAKALDKAKPCGDLLQVRNASAKLLGARTVAYDLSFHFAKRICTNNNMTLEIPADIACSSIIALSGTGAKLNVDIRGAKQQACSIDGNASNIAQFAAKKVFKRHTVDLTQQLPPEFQGVAVNVRSIAFDTSPSAPRLRITGDATMTDQQFAAFTAKARAVSRSHK